VYRNKPSFVYGFHGLDKGIALKILNQELELECSENSYDWLGRGTYFWENNLSRAWEYALADSKRPNTKIKEAFVLGAVIDLGNCLDLLDQQYLDFLKVSYLELKKSLDEESKECPVNSGFGQGDFDFKKRELDCAVIRLAHELAKEKNESFDTVWAAFWAGEELYPNAGFKSKNPLAATYPSYAVI